MRKKFDNLRISLLPRAVVAVTSKNTTGDVGATTISWVGILSSQPSMVYVSFLPDSFTRQCIIDSREFVVNVPSVINLPALHILGSISGSFDKKSLELKKNGESLTLNPSYKVNSPYLAEFPYAFECRVMHTIQVGLYDCFIGLVLAMHCKSENYSLEHPKGEIDFSKINPIVCLSDKYWRIGESLGYTKENKNHPHGDTH